MYVRQVHVPGSGSGDLFRPVCRPGFQPEQLRPLRTLLPAWLDVLRRAVLIPVWRRHDQLLRRMREPRRRQQQLRFLRQHMLWRPAMRRRQVRLHSGPEARPVFRPVRRSGFQPE